MFLHYLKVTLREQFTYKTQSLVSILGLAIGFTAFLLGGYWLWWETHFDDFHPESDRLYCLTTEGIVRRANGQSADLDQLHVNDREELRKLLPEIEEMCSFWTLSFTLDRSGDPVKLHGMESDSSFFRLFQADFINGTYKGTVPDGQSVVLTETTARKLFGSVDCVGKEVAFSEDFRPVVAGVVRNYPDNTDLLFQFLVIRTARPNQVKRLKTYVRLQEGTDVEKVRTKLAAYKSRAGNLEEGRPENNWKVNLRSASEVHLTCHPELTDRLRNIRILALAGFLAFVSALMNLLVLFIGQQQRKQQKNRTYACVGASPKSMLLKGAIELLLPMAVAYLLAFCLIELIFPYYEEYTSWNLYGVYEDVARHIDRSRLFTSVLLIAAGSTVVFFLLSYWPLRRIARQGNYRSAAFKRGLIVAQVFIGSLFFVTSLGLFRQLHYILSKEKGIDYENVIQVDLGYQTAWQTDLRVLKPEMENHPFVKGVTYTADHCPVFTEQGDWYGSMETHFCLDVNETDPDRPDIVVLADPGFFQFFGLQLKAGRWIDEADPNGILVNETCFRQLGYDDLIDRPVYNPRSGETMNLKICGVINDYVYAPMQYPVLPLFFMLQTNPRFEKYAPAYLFYVRYAPGHKKEVLDHLRKVTSRITEGRPETENRFVELSDMVNRFNRPDRVIFTIFSILALLCILISSFGIYSLVSLSAQQRKKEIAIRKVNGATFSHILQLFFREYLILVVLGNAFALPLGYLLMKRWLETYSFRTSLPFYLFLSVFFITALIVLLSIFRQVKKAAEANPAEAVKAD